MTESGSGGRAALEKTIALVNYLVEFTDRATRDPVRDIVVDEDIETLWFDDLPTGVSIRSGSEDGTLLVLRPPARVQAPRVPPALVGWVEPAEPNDPAGSPPQLVAADDEVNQTVDVAVYQTWLLSWKAWAQQERQRRTVGHVYEWLDKAMRRLDQHDEEWELVLGAGLLCWHRPDGYDVRRHLLVQQVQISADQESAALTVALAGEQRLESRAILIGLEEYRPERAKAVSDDLIEDDRTLLETDEVVAGLSRWLGLTLAPPVKITDSRVTDMPLPVVPELTASPALVLRRRDVDALADAYRKIAHALVEPDASVPVGLAQVVVDSEPEERQAWLGDCGRALADLLGEDPLFPLEVNNEQRKVLELLRSETGVVVQGPPGTGKTHTIANLVSALLASGQRVLVTSQKDQALRELRNKIPEELRNLCVLLTGGSRGATDERQRSLETLANVQASADRRDLPRRCSELADQRMTLSSKYAQLTKQIRALRESEIVDHPPVTPGWKLDRYRGALAKIVGEVQEGRSQFDWIPAVPTDAPDTPPLDHAELLDLVELAIQRRQQSASRTDQTIPEVAELPGLDQLTQLISSERDDQAQADRASTAFSDIFSRLNDTTFQELEKLVGNVRSTWEAICHDPDYASGGDDWRAQAMRDVLSDRRRESWRALLSDSKSAHRLQRRLNEHGTAFHVEFDASLRASRGEMARLRDSGRRLADRLAQGARLHRTRILQTAVERDAAPLLQMTLVNGARPTTAEAINVALTWLDADIEVSALVARWRGFGVEIIPNSEPRHTLAEIADHASRLDRVLRLELSLGAVRACLARANEHISISSVDKVDELLGAIVASQLRRRHERTRHELAYLAEHVSELARMSNGCLELADLSDAIACKDGERCRRAFVALDKARTEQKAEKRFDQLARELRDVHPELMAELVKRPDDPRWQSRLRNLADAWAWSKANTFAINARSATHERTLQNELNDVEGQLARTTEDLAAHRAMRNCLDRMSDYHAGALRSYGRHIRNIGAGRGRKTREFRRAAKAALRKAQPAIPAWVVPLPNLLDNIEMIRDQFDVVVVDEAAQVGVEHLYLLWLAPRLIVVGDDKQCAPGPSRFGPLDPAFARLEDHLASIEVDVRLHLTAKSNIYSLMESRSGKDAVIRLREHFRSVPEIIEWSSRTFYSDTAGRSGLAPLRDRKLGSLTPLEVRIIEGGILDGSGQRRSNQIEAKQLVAQLAECVRDPRYSGKTFGVIALQYQTQAQLLDKEIMANLSSEERQAGNIRAGLAADFQGGERDVIFLSMAVANEFPAALTAASFEQSFNVAATRARDQMWLFSSLPPNLLKDYDLRRSLLDYMMNPPPILGASPSLDSVPADTRCQPFESLLEQKVFREIKLRGFDVVPQYPVGNHRVDLVVRSPAGSIAVECDGAYWHGRPGQEYADLLKDRQLRRVEWKTVRIRESEFEYDRTSALQSLWEELAANGINPIDPPNEDEVKQ